MHGARGMLQGVQERLPGPYVREAVERASASRPRMTRGEWLALLAYAAALLFSRAWLPHLTSPVSRAAAALLPLPPIALVVAFSVRRVLRMDEPQRRIELVALASAGVGGWLGLVACWPLQRAGAPVPSPLLGFCALALLYNLARRRAARHCA